MNSSNDRDNLDRENNTSGDGVRDKNSNPGRNNPNFSKVKIRPNNPESISEVRKLFMPDDLFEFLAESSNRYYDKKHRTTPWPWDLKWEDLTAADIKKMLGLILAIGCIYKRNLNDYWTKTYHDEIPPFERVMSKDRFLQAWVAFACHDEDEIKYSNDPMREVQPLIMRSLRKIQSVYTPSPDLELKEMIVPCGNPAGTPEIPDFSERERFEYTEDFEVTEKYLATYRALMECACERKAMMLYTFGMCEFNAFAIYKILNPNTKITYRQFIQAGIEDWTGCSDLFDNTTPYWRYN